MKFNHLFATAILLTSNCFASGHQIALDGKYDCKGNEIGTNSVFKCVMTIKKTGETYASSATCDDGNFYRGNGIYNENTHAISSVFINPKKAEETGVTLTYVKEDGSMNIDWTYLDNTTLGHSTCNKQR